MTRLVPAHGGTLVDRFVSEETAKTIEITSEGFPSLVLDAIELADLELIAHGAFSPLTGFLGSSDYQSTLRDLRLSNGTVWPLPITLAVPDNFVSQLPIGSRAALRDDTGRLRGVILVEEVYRRDPLEEVRAVYRTEDPSHPGVAYNLKRPEHLVGGTVFALPSCGELSFQHYRLSPRQLRVEIATRGWSDVAGFQTRNPIHRAHEHLTKLALEVCDGLVLHPLVGETSSTDVPPAVRMKCYQVLLENYYPKHRTLLAVFPAAMRYAGPREALFHALVRKNYGINRLIVGRDHAGVGSFYEPGEAQRIFDRFSYEELGIRPLHVDPTFFCLACDATTSARSCPHGPGKRLEISGRRMREILRAGGYLPHEFTRPEVAEILREHYMLRSTHQPSRPARPRQHRKNGQGFILWLTGLSGAGKTTLARRIEQLLLGSHALEVLDGDEMRNHICEGLGFSKTDRNTNVSRIGHVARLLARNGVRVIVAAISPYADARDAQRRLAVEEEIPFLEIFVNATLTSLIHRDTKGLYRRALDGELPHFTGISSPYEPPRKPELMVQTDQASVDACALQILELLCRLGLAHADSVAA